MEEEFLFTHYSLHEAIDRDLVVNKLKSLKRESKIELTFDGDIFKIKDIELEEIEINEIINLFDENDIFPYHIDEEEDDYDDYNSDYDDYDDYDF